MADTNYNNHMNIPDKPKRYDEFFGIIKTIADKNKDCQCTYYLASTFGINLIMLENIFRTFPRLRHSFDVYYDKNHGTNHFSSKSTGLFADRLHPVDLGENYFHPKIQIFRFEKEKQCRYIVTVSSMNLTASDNMEAYVALEGTLTEQPDVEPNGKKLSEYLNSLLKPHENSIQKKIITDLAACDFTLFPAQADNSVIRKIEFLGPKELFEAVQKLDNITVVSPFVKAGLVRKLYNKTEGSLPIKRLVISQHDEKYTNIDGFKEFDIEYYAVNKLHGKIYCGLCEADEPKTEQADTTDENSKLSKDSVLIIGSSNFTSAGFGNNAEMNVMITFRGSSFNENFMGDYFNKDNLLEFDLISNSEDTPEESDESFDKRNIGIGITDVSYKNSVYTFGISANAEMFSSEKEQINEKSETETVLISLEDGEMLENSVLIITPASGNKKTMTFSSKNDILRIYYKNNDEKIYLTSYLLPNLVESSDETFSAHLSEIKKNGNTQFQNEHIIKLLTGKNTVVHVNKQHSHNKNSTGSSNADTQKMHWHEHLLKMAQLYTGREAFAAKLDEIYTELSAAYTDKETDKTIHEFIDYLEKLSGRKASEQNLEK